MSSNKEGTLPLEERSSFNHSDPRYSVKRSLGGNDEQDWVESPDAENL